MSVADGDVLQAVVTFTSAAGAFFQNKYSWQADFTSGQSGAVVLAAIGLALEAIYGELAGEFLVDIDDPVAAVDKLAWVTDHWEISENVGEVIVGTTFTNASEQLPRQSAAVLVGRTNRPRSRGRKFLPPFGEDTQDDSDWAAGTKANLADALIEYLSIWVIAAGIELIPGVPSSVTGAFLPFVSGLVSDWVRTQRRRVPGQGA